MGMVCTIIAFHAMNFITSRCVGGQVVYARTTRPLFFPTFVKDREKWDGAARYHSGVGWGGGGCILAIDVQ